MNNRLGIQEIAGILSEKTGRSKSECERFLRTFVAVVTDGLMTDKLVKIKGVGAFKLVLVEQRESVDVNTGERFMLPAHYKVSFTPDAEMKELVNEPFSFFETTELSDHVDVNDLQTPEEEPELDEPVELTEIVDPKQEPVQLPVRSDKRRWGFATWVVVFLFILCGVFGYLYIGSQYVVDLPVATPPVIVEDPALLPDDDTDNLIPESIPGDSLAAKEETKEETDVPFKEITIVRIRENDRLTYLAEKYYGNRAFWVYIYQFNRSVIRNPDVITVGMELVIPDPAVYGIDASDSTSVRRAFELQKEINETKE